MTVHSLNCFKFQAKIQIFVDICKYFWNFFAIYAPVLYNMANTMNKISHLPKKLRNFTIYLEWTIFVSMPWRWIRYVGFRFLMVHFHHIFFCQFVFESECVQRYKKFLTFASDSAWNACFLSGLNILLHWGGICSPHISNFLFFPYNSPLSPQNNCKSQYISVLLCIHLTWRTDGEPTVNRRSTDSQGWRQASVRLLSPRKMAKNCSTNTILYIYI